MRKAVFLLALQSWQTYTILKRMIIVDSKSIQNADTAEAKGYNAGKNVRGKTAHWG